MVGHCKIKTLALLILAHNPLWALLDLALLILVHRPRFPIQVPMQDHKDHKFLWRLWLKSQKLNRVKNLLRQRLFLKRIVKLFNKLKTPQKIMTQKKLKKVWKTILLSLKRLCLSTKVRQSTNQVWTL